MNSIAPRDNPRLSMSYGDVNLCHNNIFDGLIHQHIELVRYCVELVALNFCTVVGSSNTCNFGFGLAFLDALKVLLLEHYPV